MDKAAATWSTRRELVQIILARQHLKRTVVVALTVGTVFVAMNQLGVILDGRATAAVWIKAALTYLTPLIVSNFGILSATRRHATHSTTPPP
jgi:hypothetical protein